MSWLNCCVGTDCTGGTTGCIGGTGSCTGGMTEGGTSGIRAGGTGRAGGPPSAILTDTVCS